MSDSDSCRVKRSKRIAKKRSKAITPEGNNPNHAGFVTVVSENLSIPSECLKYFLCLSIT